MSLSEFQFENNIVADRSAGPASVENVSVIDLRSQPSVTMSLLGRAVSPAAKAAIAALVAIIYQPNGRQRGPNQQYINALGASLSDFTCAIGYDPIRSCFRPMGNTSFDGSIGYYSFKRVLDDLERNDFVTVHKGYAGNNDRPGLTTRIRATVRLAHFLHEHGIAAFNAHEHFFRPKTFEAAEPIRLKAGSKRNACWKKIPGKPMPVDMSNPRVLAYASAVRDINEHMSKQTFSFPGEVVFFRGFNCGDQHNYQYDKSGRLYCYGGGYQSMPKSEVGKNGKINPVHRKQVLINYEQTKEDDISACHITQAHGMLGLPLPNRVDLYDHPTIDRGVVKCFVTMTLGAGKIPGKWSDGHKEDFDSIDLKRLNQEYPIKDVANKVLDHIPVLQAVLDKGLNWADFQFVESEIMIEAVHSLIQDEGITTLPVHDSFIVPVEKREICQRYLINSFEKRIGLKPALK